MMNPSLLLVDMSRIFLEYVVFEINITDFESLN